MMRAALLSVCLTSLVRPAPVVAQSAQAGTTAPAVATAPDLRHLQGIAYRDSLRATLVGGRGVVQTEDGGLSWVQRVADSTIGLRAVAFADAEQGVAVGARILRTTDGGRSWSVVAPPAGVAPYLKAVAFADSRNGVAVGGGGAMLRTTDAGATWQVVPTGTEYELESVRLSGLKGWVVGRNVVLRTADGGARWRLEPKPSTTYHDVAFFGEHSGVAVGFDLVHVTNDGGDRWTSNAPGLLEYIQEAQRRGFYTAQYRQNAAVLYDVAMPAPGLILAVNHTSGAIARSTDGGQRWRPHDSGSRRGFNAIGFADARHGLVAGAEGVFRTVDGGETWAPVGSAAAGRLALGALTGTWNLRFNSVDTPRLRCEFDPAATLTISHADTTFTGTISGWQVRCAATTVSQFGNLVTGTTTTTTTNSGLTVTLPAATPVTGTTDRLRTFAFLLEHGGAHGRFEARLDAKSMNGVVVLRVVTPELGTTELTVNWTARR